MIYEVTLYQVVCDAPDCFAESTQTESETAAKKHARDDGFVAVGNEWFCAKHSPKKKMK